mmetsp:Transcript_27355/g.70820  ORF Transcript_27355/g.70820 Transcript_27355/m.70820 type:complete len:113 (+) Transcript_27355:138-476(+)
MRKVAALALLASGRAFVLPANAARRTTLQADMLEAPLDLVRSQHAQLIGQYLDDVVAEPLDLVRDHHAYMWEEFADQARTPLDLVSTFHEGLSREHRAADVSQLRSPWGHAG